MEKNSGVFFVTMTLIFISATVLAEVPKGFLNSRDSKPLMEAWKNKVLMISFPDVERDFLKEKGMRWEFNDFEDAKMYIVKTDGSQVLKAKGHVTLKEYINVDSPGYTPGVYVLQFVATGYTFGTSFKEPIDPKATTFKDSRKRVYEVMSQ